MDRSSSHPSDHAGEPRPAVAETQAPADLRHLPARYRTRWQTPFDQAIEPKLFPGARILDLGSGRNPYLPLRERPVGSEYVGLDISADELGAASPEAYDQVVVADISVGLPDRCGQFDLVLSWQMLEHVADLPVAAGHVFDSLVPAGLFVAMLSGRYAAYAAANRLLPDRLGEAVVTRVMDRKAESSPVFPAHYDLCYESALRRVFAAWSRVDIVPLYRAAPYFEFSAVLQRCYLAYENFIYRYRYRNLATHYLVVAEH